METFNHLVLRALRKAYCKVTGRTNRLEQSNLSKSPDEASDLIYQYLMSDNPCMVARFGADELGIVCNYLSIIGKHHSAFKFIKGEEEAWWWDHSRMRLMRDSAGFFPADEEHLTRFCELMLEDAKYVDVLGRWIKNEGKAIDLDAVKSVRLLYLEPYLSRRPWSRALEGKRVLVVHPFTDMIKAQYANHREHLFANKDVLPSFHLTTVQSVMSYGGHCDYSDWFEALQWMKDEIDKKDYDVALIGCGAYGFPLAAHVKRKGKKAVHLGGALQLLFGIKGKKFEDPMHGALSLGETGRYPAMFNEHWVYPDEKFRPANSEQVDEGAYWKPKD